MTVNKDEQQTWVYHNVSANGLSFRVAVAGSGDRLLLCLHGFPESALSWRHQLAPLAHAGYRVWAPDLRGYAGTSKPDGIEAYHLDQLLDDVTALINHAQARQVILVGHDWGGVIAWYYAMRHAARIDGLIILNAPHPACFEREIRRWRQLRRSWYMLAGQIPRLPEWILTAKQARLIGVIFDIMRAHPDSIPDHIVRCYRQQAAEPGALTAMINYYRAAILGGGARRQRRLGYPTVRLPTLVIWGLHDQALTRHNLDGLDGFVMDLTIIPFPHAGHFVHEDDPQRVTDDMLCWLSDRFPRASSPS
ncbi:MAG: alpha/beta hydrolase [Nitrospira sp.]|nr:alpha/beta hydrolase [Nitrospira sp.]